MKYPKDIINLKNQKKITMLTAYDYSMATILNTTDIDLILVGDSLATTVMGLEDTIAVKIEHMIHHACAVRKGAKDKFIVVDVPFMTNIYSTNKALSLCTKLIQETNANALKIEGGLHNKVLIEKLILAGVPVMGHLGLTPQSYLSLNGYKVQGKDEASKLKLIEDAKLLESLGVFAIVLECVESNLAKAITKDLSIPSIGIGSGVNTDGQVLVINDLLNLGFYKAPSFAKAKVDLNSIIKQAIEDFIKEL